MSRIETLLEMLQENPHDNFLRHALSMEYVSASKDDEAQILLENILQDSPDYIGSYYQLGKILERKNDTDAALQCYERGMHYARKADNIRAFNELQSARNELLY